MIKWLTTPLRTVSLAAALMMAGVGVLALPAAHTQAATAALSQGADGTEVTELQSNLQKLGYFFGSPVTGYYGPITEQAVSWFQAAYGFAVSGQADGATQTAIAHAALKKQLIADTYSYAGTPYVWGGTTPTGFDCSGFVHFMFTKFGIDAHRTTAAEMYDTGFAVDRNSLQPGDLVFFSSGNGAVTHVGFYVGDNRFISATRSAGIAVQQLDNGYWGPRYAGAKRLY